jgi:hypothetical protein
LPLGEKLQIANTLFSDNDDLEAAADKLRKLMTMEAIDRSEPSKDLLFNVINLTDQNPKNLMFLPIVERLIKEIKVASSNQIDLNPVYRDYLTEIHSRFISP